MAKVDLPVKADMITIGTATQADVRLGIGDMLDWMAEIDDRMWQKSVVVTEGEIRTVQSEGSWWLIECQGNGTTGASEPADWGAGTGNVVADGTTNWKSYKAPAYYTLDDTVRTASILNLAVTTAKLADGAVTTPKIGDGAVTAAKLGSDVAIVGGITDYIIEGLELTTLGGNAKITAGSAIINSGIASPVASTVALPGSNKVALFFVKADATIDKILGNWPAVDDDAIAIWRINDINNIVNSAVGNPIAVSNTLTSPGGITQVSGWLDNAAKGNGSTGYFISANATNFPTVLPTNISRSYIIIYTQGADLTSVTLISHGIGGAGNSFNIGISSGGALGMSIGGSFINFEFYPEEGSTYCIVVNVYEATLAIGHKVVAYVNGQIVANFTLASFTGVLGVMNILRKFDATEYSDSTIHYVELRRRPISPRNVALISNQLLFPFTYQKPEGAYPDLSSFTDTHEWKFNALGGTVSDTGNAGAARDLTYTDDGNVQLVESGIALTAAMLQNSLNPFTSGAYAFGNTFTVLGVIYPSKTGAAQTIISNKNGATGMTFRINASNEIEVKDEASPASYSGAKRVINPDKPIFFAFSYNNGNCDIYTDSPNPERVTATVDTTSNNILSDATSTMVYEYLFITTDAMSQSEIKHAYDLLMAKSESNAAKDLLNSDEISLGFVHVNDDDVVEKISTEYKYGRLEKATGGNRQVFLGWDYFDVTGSIYSLKKRSPFGNKKIKVTFYYSPIASFDNALLCMEHFDNGATEFGIVKDYDTGKNEYPIQGLIHLGGLIRVDGTWVKTGFIGTLVEILEDL